MNGTKRGCYSVSANELAGLEFESMPHSMIHVKHNNPVCTLCVSDMHYDEANISSSLASTVHALAVFTGHTE